MPHNPINSWKSTLLPLSSSIKEAIRSLEISGMQIVLVVSDDKTLIGTLTDGDIRRAFLRGCGLNDGIQDLINQNPLATSSVVGRDDVIQIMRENKIHQLPVVNSDGRIEGLHLWDSLDAEVRHSNLVVIMAGGRGVRLHPYTQDCPKPMLQIGGKPLLEHIIVRAKEDGFRNFVISVNYLGHIIEDYFNSGAKWGVDISYLREDLPLGTIGALSMLPSVPKEPFIVVNGDVLTNIQFGNMLNYHAEHNASATMAVRQYELQNQFGVVKLGGIEIEGFEEKPVYRSQINAGMYVFDPLVLTQLELGHHCDIPTLFDRIKNKVGKIIAFPMHENWLDVGRPDDLVLANKFLLNN